MTPSKVIDVPKTEPAAFNKKRPAGKLLQSQIVHLHEALVNHLHEVTAVLAVDHRSLKTEGEVSNYIRSATAILHPHGVKRLRK